MKELTISGKTVSKDSPVLIIAEAGINHDGSYEQALKLIDAAVDAKADIVKFQLFRSEKMYNVKAGNFVTAKGETTDINKLLKSVELPTEWIPELMEYCDQKGIGFLCTTCDEESSDSLEKLGVDSYKLASYGITHIPLLKHTAKKQLPIVFSSGAATLSEVDDAVRAITDQGNTKIALLHCVAKYPAPLSSCNMNILDTFLSAYPDAVIGYSDHTEDPVKAPVVAVYKGAKIIEKHFTIDKNLPGADHSFALNPEQLKMMVDAIRQVEKEKSLDSFDIPELSEILGSSEKRVADVEEHLREYAFRALYATKNISKGEAIDKSNMAVLRPGENVRGIAPKYMELLIENEVKANRDIEEGEPILWKDVLNQ
ncbi:N-acetylneuraminate synthase family protein [Enterococcus sp. BWR-S5]|uniref:N-acetylneuraminate synthase family protein n=1 Tax=Enterococcus sp. BWR-S5 TaxID=2787714 RepID=UPI001923E85F|nr:N-acetylneuraminate synthase family protein [Enterococcus sp. BWR-S5]MBL1224737.1 N-acetylneuraminate synthase family protein [Enterococcus sp. BWR-S5]